MPDLEDNYKAEDTDDKTAEEKRKEKSDESGNRPTGTREMTDSTGINPDEVDEIKEDMPTMPPA